MSNSLELLRTNKGGLPAPNAPRVNVVSAAVLVLSLALGLGVTLLTLNPAGAIVGALVGLLLSQSPKVARQ